MTCKPLFIVDGDNVMGEMENNFIIEKLLSLLSAISPLGDIIVIVSAATRHRIDDVHEYRKLLRSRAIFQAPAGIDEDAYILEIASETGGIVVSNDRFREYEHLYREVIAKKLTFMIIPHNNEWKTFLPWKKSFSPGKRAMENGVSSGVKIDC
ncbi:MAG: hypothetical protein ACFFD4_30910 [Candidatus Odinarchaeota archaeon]